MECGAAPSTRGAAKSPGRKVELRHAAQAVWRARLQSLAAAPAQLSMR